MRVCSSSVKGPKLGIGGPVAFAFECDDICGPSASAITRIGESTTGDYRCWQIAGRGQTESSVVGRMEEIERR